MNFVLVFLVALFMSIDYITLNKDKKISRIYLGITALVIVVTLASNFINNSPLEALFNLVEPLTRFTEKLTK